MIVRCCMAVLIGSDLVGRASRTNVEQGQDTEMKESGGILCKVVGSRECFATMWADVGFFLCVCSDVSKAEVRFTVVGARCTKETMLNLTA